MLRVVIVWLKLVAVVVCWAGAAVVIVNSLSAVSASRKP